jgi:hypothetical protein
LYVRGVVLLTSVSYQLKSIQVFTSGDDEASLRRIEEMEEF